MMNTLRLIALAIRLHWDAQRSNPANLFAAVVGMVINNVLVLWGLWAMLFDGKPDGHAITVYFLALNGMLTISWGSVCFFLGGLHALANYIDEGSLEPMLATPRHPLLVTAISKSVTPALGDLVQGALVIVALFFIASVGEALRAVLAISVCTVAVMGLFILTGSIPFFVKRGTNLALLLREICLSLSFYPSGKVFSGYARLFLYVSPAAVMAFLPMSAIESGSWSWGIAAVVAAIVFLAFSILVFNRGLRRYQTASYVMARD